MAQSERDLRSKEEIAEDIERTRRKVRSAFFQTRDAVVEQNPAVRAWRAMKQKAIEARYQSRVKARKTDVAIRTHLYRTIAFAAIAGLIAGVFFPRKPKIYVYREK